jgi:hypothetical protein
VTSMRFLGEHIYLKRGGDEMGSCLWETEDDKLQDDLVPHAQALQLERRQKATQTYDRQDDSTFRATKNGL